MKRRDLGGKKLLVASVGAATMSFACSKDDVPIRTGNLVPPPQVRVCVEPDPADASVSFDGQPRPDKCQQVYEGNVTTIRVEKAGFTPHEEKVSGIDSHEVQVIKVKLAPAEPTDAPDAETEPD